MRGPARPTTLISQKACDLGFGETAEDLPLARERGPEMARAGSFSSYKGTALTFGDFQLCGLTLRAIRRDPQRDPGRLHASGVVGAPKGEGIRIQIKSDLAGFAWPKRDRLKTFQHADRHSDAGTVEADVELGHGFAGARTGVGDLGADSQHFIADGTERLAQRRDGKLLRVRLRVAVAKSCVGKSEAKGKLRRVRLVDVARHVFLLAGLGSMVGIGSRTSGIERVVIQRLLADGTRPG